MTISGAEILRDLNISSKCNVEAIKNTKSRLSLTVWVNVVMNRTVVVDSDWRFDNLCGRHVRIKVSWWYYTMVIDLIGQLRRRDVIG